MYFDNSFITLVIVFHKYFPQYSRLQNLKKGNVDVYREEGAACVGNQLRWVEAGGLVLDNTLRHNEGGLHVR